MTPLWMPLYIGDYLADTMHLSTDQHGGYLLLIMSYWRNGKAIADDDSKLAAITKSTAEEWVVLRPILAEFFDVRDGFWHHKRIECELIAAKKRTKARSKAGKEGAAKRWQNDGKRIAEPLANASQNDAQLQSQLQSKNVIEIAKAISPSNPRLRDRVFDEDFELWWRAVPRKVGKTAAKAAYAKARRKHGVSADALLDGIRRYADATRSNGTAEQYIVHPTTWLNAGRWQDEEGIDNGHARRDVPSDECTITDEEILAALRERKTGVAW